MSLTKSSKLVLVATEVCRELRKKTTKAEELFWQEVRNRKFRGLKFYRQHPIFVDDDGHETFFVADFYCHGKRIAIELDGKIHEHQQYKDVQREQLINDLGIHVIRFKNEEIELDLGKAMDRLEESLTAQPSPSLTKRRGRGMSSLTQHRK